LVSERDTLFDLTGRVAVVTGGGRGIGRGIAEGLAAFGARVVLTGRTQATLDRAAVEMRGRGYDVLAQMADVSREGDVTALRDSVLGVCGRIDILVNNAGVTRRADIMELTEADWDRIHRVNAKGVFFCLQRVAREMIPRRSGRIINIASIAGKGYAGTSNAAYAASKGAVIALTKTASQQLGKHNINVNSICPGVTRTALSDANLSVRAERAGITMEEMDRRRAEGIPLQRTNDPEDIAAMAVFLVSAGARNITGQSFNVDGGIIPD
jgi:NAD(P)-dependent dehydrogenase (short-subunit alcohol dehydrogenase family)